MQLCFFTQLRDRPRAGGRFLLAGLLLSLAGPATAGPWAGLVPALQRSELVTPAFRDPLARFYAQRGYEPLWFNSQQPSARSDTLRMVLAHAGREGLNPDDYLTPALRASCSAPVTEPVACELRLSDSLLRYAQDVGYGAVRAADPCSIGRSGGEFDAPRSGNGFCRPG